MVISSSTLLISRMWYCSASTSTCNCVLNRLCVYSSRPRTVRTCEESLYSSVPRCIVSST